MWWQECGWACKAREGEAATFEHHFCRPAWSSFVNRLIDLPPNPTAHRSSTCCSCKVARPCWSQMYPQRTVHLFSDALNSAFMPKCFAFLKETASFKLCSFSPAGPAGHPSSGCLPPALWPLCQGCRRRFSSRNHHVYFYFKSSWLNDIFLPSLFPTWYIPPQVTLISDSLWLHVLDSDTHTCVRNAVHSRPN